MSDTGVIKRSIEVVRGSLTLKLLAIGLLVLILLIPTAMVQSLIKEREGRKTEAVLEISGKWGEAQTLAGPVLTIPYRHFYLKSDGTREYEIRAAHFLPKTLDIQGRLTPEVRYRGIYEAVLYSAELAVEGRFERPDVAALDIPAENVLWDRASLSFGIGDMKGIRDGITVAIGDAALPLNPGIDTREVLASGVSARLPAGMARGREIPFRFNVHLNGSDRIRFVPVGEVTQVNLASPWKSPSFEGSFLPATRAVDDSGFSAAWKVLHLNRNFPQAWTGTRERIADAAFGVRLFVTADVYQQATRTAKYAVLFIVLTFTTFFFSELLTRKRLHPIQYLLIGFALVIFYTLLIALSEHIRFGLAYLFGAASVVGLITAYAHGVLANTRLTSLVGGILVILYGYLYIVLQLEDYALLMGSIGLFVALAAVMYVTRRIDWYGTDAKTRA